jgi:hypothetical protein
MGVMSVAARRVLPVVFVLAFVVGVSVLGGASASAEVVHNFEFSFNGSAAPGGAFTGDLGTVAVDQANGDVYVVENERAVVERFDAAGKYLGEITGTAVPQGSLGLFYYTSGVAVDNSTGPNKGDLYVAGTNNNVVYRFDSSGKLLAELNGSATPSGSFTAGGVAVDASGNLFVADRASDVVDEFSAAGAYTGQLSSPEILEPASIGVDSSDDVYLNNFGQSVVKLMPGGGASVLDTNHATSVAVDPATDHVFVAENYYPAPGLIAEYDPSGSRLGASGEEHISSNVLGVAVRGSTGEVYAADNNRRVVDVFGPGVVVPDAVTEAASGVQPTGVTFNGTVDPDGLPVSGCRFEYGTGSSYGESVACEQSLASIGSGSGPIHVSASASGLSPDATYHFRLVVTNANGTNRGLDETVTATGPARVESESVSGVTRTGATFEAQILPFGFDTKYRFEYGTSSSYGASAPIPDADIGSGMSAVAVSQAVGGLRSGVTYHYRVVATSSQGTVPGSDQTFATVPPAYIDGVYATDVASTSATLNAKLNPIGTSTEYRLEYGTTSAYGQTLTGSTGEVGEDVQISVHLQELATSTAYHYRLVAHNAFGTMEGADHTFTTQHTGEELSLPDGRAWELVSPPDKKGALINAYKNGDLMIQAAADGSGILYEASDTIGENPQGKNPRTPVLSVRGPAGWGSTDINVVESLPPEGFAPRDGEQTFYTLFSADLSLGVVEQPGERLRYPQPRLSPEASERTPYLRNVMACASASGCYTPLVTPGDVEPKDKKFGGEEGETGLTNVIGGTPDMNHVVVQSPHALVTGAHEATNISQSNAPQNLYEWSGSQLHQINVLPDGTSEPEASLGYRNGVGGNPFVAHTISSDGRRIVWSRGYWYQGTEKGNVELFVRDMVEERTVRVGGSQAEFQSMSSDGSRVLYREGGELYELNIDTGALSAITANHGRSEANAGVKDGVLGSSEDGSYVYFVASGLLASGAAGGADNLYVAHDGAGGWQTTFVAGLSSEDEKSWASGSDGTKNAQAYNAGEELSRVSSRVSANGHYVTFMSSRSLTGYDSVDAVSGQPDEEVYLYDAVANRLVCASCNPTGARPVGVLDTHAGLLVDPGGVWGSETEGAGSEKENHWLAGIIPSWFINPVLHFSLYQPRSLSDSGRLFFDSPDALVPQATNGVMDVYEYEPTGVGDCSSASATFSERSGGCVNLLSDGTANEESMFYDASESGDDVFFITTSRLTGEDYDNAYDVYDAHVCSASAPCHAAAVSPPPCTSGDSCKAAPAPQPEIFGPAPSATFSGTGNVVEEAKKGKAKQKAKKGRQKKRKKKRKRGRARGSRRTGHASGKGGRR